MNRTVVIGGTGLLGTALKNFDNDLLCIGSEYDIYNFIHLEKYLNSENPNIIINCAAILSFHVDNTPIEAINVNIIGAANAAKYCIKHNKRLVYISTDYVYPGITGNYKEADPLFPENKYAWTKLGGEAATELVSNHLIIRTSFGAKIFPYPVAYSNLYTSRDYVDTIAPMILNIAKSSLCGTVNVGTTKKSMAEFANHANCVPSIEIPKTKDFSFNLEKYDNYITTHNL